MAYQTPHIQLCAPGSGGSEVITSQQATNSRQIEVTTHCSTITIFVYHKTRNRCKKED